jgi:hypothetical protein
MEEIGKLIANYGLPTVAVIALGWYILRRDKENKEERKEWLKIATQGHDAINKNTDALSALKTLLETTIRR